MSARPLIDALRTGKAQFDAPGRYIWAFSLFPAMVRWYAEMKLKWAMPYRYVWAFSFFPALGRLLGNNEDRQ